ncbi:response regulator [Ramlibacter sp. AW1]|uniref:Response regulator n=1 Tax=Ramlibacter aurantiacus TaxID=2801330 RepID=A0A936ZLE9_9BURK|nr:response regulator [Ramlibacter aurantiacus]
MSDNPNHPDSQRPGRDPQPADAARSTAPGQPAHVLVVDDNRDAADTLVDILMLSGFTASAAYDGASGLQALQQQPPQAVLLDIGLPDLDGHEVCRRIRALPLSPQPVVLALTGWGQEKDRERTAAAGFDGHLTKPADPTHIMELLGKLLPR